jgi:competence protein ComEC
MIHFVQTTPFFRILVALIVGIVLANQVTLSSVVLMTIAVFCVIGIVLNCFFIEQYRFRWLFGVSIFGLLVLLGIWCMERVQQRVAFPQDGIKGVFLVEISDAPIEKSKSTLYQVNILRWYHGMLAQAMNKRVFLYVTKDSLHPLFDFGDQLLVSTTFAPVRSSGNPETFDFNRYLQNHGISATGYVSSGNFRLVKQGSGFSLYAASSHLRAKLLNVYRQYHIDGDEFAVVAALMLGYNDALSRELRDSYSVSGTMHVLSVSGLHVAIIYAVFSFLLGFMDKKRKLFVIKQLLIVLLLWGFAFLTGLAPAVIRATLMFSLVALGLVLLRKPQIMNTVLFSAFVMLLIHPSYLYDVGFQLSYIAVVSIVYFEPKFKTLIYIRNKPLKWIWGLLCVSVAAQLGTSALGVFYFHRFANFFWLGNLVVVPAAAWIMYTAMTLLAVSPFPAVASVVAVVLKWMLVVMNDIIRWIEHLPSAAYNCWIDEYQLFLSFVVIIAFAAYFSSKRFLFLTVSLSAVMLFLTDSLWRTYDGYEHHQVVVLADNQHTHIDFLLGKRHYAITSDSVSLNEMEKAFYLKKRTYAPRCLTQSFASFDGRHFLVTDDSLFRDKRTTRFLKVDYLIVGNKTRISFEKLHRFVEPKNVIIDQTISPWYRRNIQHACDSLGIMCVDMKKTGAVQIAL